MKRRWQILFGCALAALVGSLWLAASLDIGMVRASTLGLVAACAIAGYAMVKPVATDKGLAAAVLGGSAIELLDTLQWLGMVMRGDHSGVGLPFALMAGGTLATVGMAIAILTAAPPPPAR